MSTNDNSFLRTTYENTLQRIELNEKINLFSIPFSDDTGSNYKTYTLYDISVSDEEDALIKKALRKQIAQPPMLTTVADVVCDETYYFCPICKNEVNRCGKKEKYCSNCGQRLDWSKHTKL